MISPNHHMIEFLVPGKPLPKGRIVRQQGGGSRWASTPARALEKKVRSYAKAAALVAQMPEPDGERLWRVGTTFLFERGSSSLASPGKNKGDNDKLARLVHDALDGAIYLDDSQARHTWQLSLWAPINAIHVIAESYWPEKRDPDTKSEPMAFMMSMAQQAQARMANQAIDNINKLVWDLR